MLDFLYFAVGMFLLAIALILWAGIIAFVCIAGRAALNSLIVERKSQKQGRPGQGGSGTMPAPPKGENPHLPEDYRRKLEQMNQSPEGNP